MIIIPFQVDARRFSVIVGLDSDGLERIQRYDPAEVTLSQLGKPWSEMKCKDVLITYCTAEDLARVREMMAAGKQQEACKHLTRGWAYRPDLGDHDRGPQSIKQ